MSVSDDVGNLFRRFGGDAGQYQEVARDDDAKEAALRWPLLNALDIVHAQPVPDAARKASTASPAVSREQGAAVARAPQSQTTADASTDAPGPARAPLFARGHRHSSMPPPVAQAPAAASRFSAPVAAAPDACDPAPVAPIPATAAQTTPFFSAPSQTFAAAPINKPVPRTNPQARQQASQQANPQPDRTEPKSESILSTLFGGKATASQPEPIASGPSRDLATLFARLSHQPGAPARSLRDSLSRLKRDGDA